jgi:hypothetical protein
MRILGRITSKVARLSKTNVPASSVNDLLLSYHCQAINQANILFWFSLIAAAIGFSLLSYAIIMSPNLNELQLLLRSLPGTMIEIGAGLFFRQARQVRRRATALLDRLRVDRQLADAIALADTISDRRIQNVIKAYLATKMTGTFHIPPTL